MQTKPREQNGVEGPCLPAPSPPCCWLGLWWGVGCPLVMQCSYLWKHVFASRVAFEVSGQNSSLWPKQGKAVESISDNTTTSSVSGKNRHRAHDTWLLRVLLFWQDCVDQGWQAAERASQRHLCQKEYFGDSYLEQEKGRLSPLNLWLMTVSGKKSCLGRWILKIGI